MRAKRSVSKKRPPAKPADPDPLATLTAGIDNLMHSLCLFEWAHTAMLRSVAECRVAQQDVVAFMEPATNELSHLYERAAALRTQALEMIEARSGVKGPW